MSSVLTNKKRKGARNDGMTHKPEFRSTFLVMKLHLESFGDKSLDSNRHITDEGRKVVVTVYQHETRCKLADSVVYGVCL